MSKTPVGCADPDCRPQLRAEIRRLKKIMRQQGSEITRLRAALSQPAATGEGCPDGVENCPGDCGGT